MKVNVSKDQFNQIGIEVAQLCVDTGLCKTKSEARRMIEQKAIRVQDELVLSKYARVVFDPDNKKLYTIYPKED